MTRDRHWRTRSAKAHSFVIGVPLADTESIKTRGA
jgi:hypothetical protein